MKTTSSKTSEFSTLGVKYYRYEITFRRNDGKDRTRIVEARNEFEAMQLAGAFGYDVVILSFVNLDL